MSSLQASSDSENQQSHNQIALLLLLGLLVLRLPFFAGVPFFTSSPPNWLSPVFEVGTYLLTLSLIWWERARLAEYHIDILVVVIIVFLKPIETIILSTFGKGGGTFPLAFPGIPAIVIWISAIGLVAALLFQHTKLPRIQGKTVIWFIAGTLIGIVTAILLAYPVTLQLGNGNRPITLPSFDLYNILVQGFIYQLGYAAVTEEPLFRGFLWGYLRRAGWREVWIWLFQAGLFWVGHIYYLGKLPISFWLVVPAGGLILGLLAWRSRSIATSMAAHAAMNGLTLTFAYLIMFYQH
jgi:membrane protease YdiL (CAAX protease family)